MSDVILKEESYKIIGACFEVYKDKGCGFLEPVYLECLEIEFRLQVIPFEPQKRVVLSYKGHVLKSTYEPDFLCYETVILEIKSVSGLADEHRAQVMNYLSASGSPLGLLVNFGHYPNWNGKGSSIRAASENHLLDPLYY